MSLLKPHTNFDSIKDMNLDELAERMANIEFNIIYGIYDTLKIPFSNPKFRKECDLRKEEWKQWLESEAEG